jgi:nitroreductase
MNVIEALNWRYSVKQFADEMIDENQVQDLLAAVRLSASSYGLQPYRLLVVKSAHIRQKLLAHSMGQDKVANSSHLIIFAAQTNIGDETVDLYIKKASAVRGVSLAELQGMSNHFKEALRVMTSQQQQEWAHQQAYLALGNLLTCAALMGIDTCPMSGFERAGFDQVLGLAKMGLTTTVICPIGKRDPDDASASMKKIRFDHGELVIGI